METLSTIAAKEDGYSLVEILVVVGIMAIIGGMSVAQLQTTRNNLRGDSAMRVVLSNMNSAREMAITQRRYIRVTFDTTAQTLSIIREDTPTTTTTLSVALFEGGAQFYRVTGTGDTPDGFAATCGAGQPSCFYNTTNGTFASATGSTSVVKFSPDGTLVDWNGVTTNGTVFTTIPSANPAARAVTVLGSTGRVRAYKWDGRQWVKV
ncbi:MAG TPA: type II secretion system protein [Vicinamibacterales bacterium]|nr:type II secretion system protein [Vicinamibacterales bacterium]